MYFPRIRELREDRDINQAFLASLINVTQTTYSKYELGKITIPTEALLKLSDYFRVTLDYLTSRDSPRKSEPVKPGLYRHFKGNEYRVLYNANHSESLEPLVVYQALYGERGIWVRPASMWSEHIERDGYSGPRFIYIGE